MGGWVGGWVGKEDQRTVALVASLSMPAPSPTEV